jgi:hypothetical protein
MPPLMTSSQKHWQKMLLVSCTATGLDEHE